MRAKRNDYYLNIAYEVCKRATCKRRHYGAIIVRDDQIVSTGYCGSPRGAPNCIELDDCPRKLQNIPTGERYEFCKGVHAEMNAIINAARSGVSILHGVLYLAGRLGDGKKISPHPCVMCKRAIINAGIKKVILNGEDDKMKIIDTESWIETHGEL